MASAEADINVENEKPKAVAKKGKKDAKASKDKVLFVCLVSVCVFR